MKVSDHLQKLIRAKLDSARILVWYDGEQAFSDFIESFSVPNCRLVSAQISRLRGRREAEEIYRQLNAAEKLKDSRANLLIYLPFARSTDEARLQDPFEVFAVAGDVFGDKDSERLESLAHQALPDFSDQVEQLFREGRPTLEMLDRLEHTPTYPLVHQAFGSRSAVEVAVQLLGDPHALKKVTDLPGCDQELLRLLADELGFAPPPDVGAWEKRRLLLARYVLFSEFAFDFLGDLPPALANLSRADEAYQDRLYAIAERLRDTASLREAYLDLATQVEKDLGLATHFVGATQLGQRDTFAFEERQHLSALTQALADEDLDRAREIIADRSTSVWRHQPERAQLWKMAERCVALLDVAGRISETWRAEAGSLETMVTAYAQPGGWSDLDRQQRLMEQSIAECTDGEELETVIQRCRDRYRAMIAAVQERFLEAVEQAGWPPEGIMRQSQIFDRFVAPALVAREKVAYFLADSLRFEMGRDLAGALDDLGEIEVQPVAAALPTVTSVGMAALLPGADGALSLRQQDDELVPYLGERRLKGLADRRDFLVEKYGDRVVDVEISEFLSLPSSKKREARLKGADLVVLRDARIDNLGENVTLREVRKHMTDLLGDLRAAAIQLARLDYCYVVIMADHGHVLLPELLPGDIVADSPAGKWTLSKRRSLLGQQMKEQAGTRVFNAAHVGIQGDVSELVVPTGFGVYTGGTSYFHGGLSLQESVLPLIALRTKERPSEQGADEIDIRYRSDHFTSRVIGLKVWYNSLLAKSIRVKIEAFDGSSPSARQMGEAADCDARDEVTHEVTLIAGQEISVPVLLDPDFGSDQVEIRATNPEAPVVWARLSLKNEILD